MVAGCDIVKWKPLMVILMKWGLKIAMWAVFVSWIAVYFLYPTESLEGFFFKVLIATGKTFFGPIGGVLLIFSGQILIIAILAAIYVAAFPRENPKAKKPKFWRLRLRTFPALVDGPFGIVSAAELIGIIVFGTYIIWALCVYTVQNHRSISRLPLPSKEKSYEMLTQVGLRIGSVGLFCMGFLFLPVARGSVLLRLIDVPVEHAIRYHVWAGHAMMWIFTLHALCFVFLWSLQGRLLHEISRWQCNNIAHLPGALAFVTGLLMWITSLHRVRKQRFELFYYTHQLYAVFIVFFVLHVGDSVFSCACGGILIFLIDRFLRFCQSRRTVQVVSATSLPCGTMELVLPKPSNLQYNALSFIFLQVRELSQLQWHPYSVSSSPLDGKHHLSILIKVLGDWTRRLKDNIENSERPKITASVEGPYGHESMHHLRYENLVLIAGGIGISPFLAILRDIMHRIRKNECCPPKNVLVVWAVKRSEEISLLSMVDAESLCPSFSDKLQLDIQIYITQESEPGLEDGKLCKSLGCSALPITDRSSSMSGLVGTGSNIWSGIYVVSSIIGFLILLGLMEAFYITPSNPKCWWFKGLLFLACMIAGIVLFGGPVIFLWNRWETRFSSCRESMNSNDKNDPTQYCERRMQTDTFQSDLASTTNLHYGCRPNFQVIFSSIAEHWGKVDVGVVACGPPSLQSSVAAECRSRTIWATSNGPIFHFNNHNFEL
ncbi:ferric reduction oxidase 6-like [Magnolia sinica]|uniref:ferric reduction oxidase 6-like n=1 Tax=Magnolia sinica TaxID=86752 RepID=UPI002659C73E|nr:ferric reduction oxidase 6-like [Magnolia sinica]XP_058089939.1 ferric reduction oxidase 6-like [Magnolia sinica]